MHFLFLALNEKQIDTRCFRILKSVQKTMTKIVMGILFGENINLQTGNGFTGTLKCTSCN